jgi:hypothetical protein
MDKSTETAIQAGSKLLDRLEENGEKKGFYFRCVLLGFSTVPEEKLGYTPMTVIRHRYKGTKGTDEGRKYIVETYLTPGIECFTCTNEAKFVTFPPRSMGSYSVALPTCTTCLFLDGRE